MLLLFQLLRNDQCTYIYWPGIGVELYKDICRQELVEYSVRSSTIIPFTPKIFISLTVTK